MEEGDSEEEDYKEDLHDSIFDNYPRGEEQIFFNGVSRVSSLVVATKSGSTSCLICLEKIRALDPIWHCRQSCYAIFHLVCIQSWARQVLNAAPQTPSTSSWHCPKCRRDYNQGEFPKEYRCYCGKEVEPASDAWLTPHTCGERCEQRLGSCEHTCMLLCHPGPCPPCPKFLQLSCYCGKQEETLRCGKRSFSCGKICGNSLGCGLHWCEKACHEGDCGTCERFGVHRCRCGKVTEVRPCSEAGFQCENVCERELGCRKHSCKKVCHAGACGECELQGRRTCPCGKKQFKELACDVKAPTCGSTCEKVLECGRHRCPERCHLGPCVGTCRLVTVKPCRCGGVKKEVPCYQDLVCERRCQSIRNCGRHACKRRCCDGDCPSCSEVCGRKLRCGNHKCPAPCHRGLCAPCPLTVKISCACGFTTLEVPCGADRDVRPPKCSKRCQTSQVCGHAELCKPHRCHYGPCPPCQLVCNKLLDCGHSCKVKCHGPRPPSAAETSKRTKKERATVFVPSEGSPCPPCTQPVIRQCMGKHPGGEKLVPCNDASMLRCESICGNLLSCRNHQCRELCHVVTVPRAPSDETTDTLQAYDSCGSCRLKCEKERKPPCQHACELGCHPGDCPPCKAPLRRPCHCGALSRSVECHTFNSLTVEEQLDLLSCKGPCHRKLENCSHMCSAACHPGPCPQLCQKKVTVRCSCQRLRKVWQCSEVQALREKEKEKSLSPASRGETLAGVLACDEECLKLRSVAEHEQNVHQRAKSVVSEARAEPKKQSNKRKARVNRNAHASSGGYCKEVFVSGFKWFLAVVGLVALGLSVYYGVRGLRDLSDWMNEIDSKRPRRKLG